MPHSTIRPDGAVCYRSKTMPLSRAAAFARCLQGNAERFCDVVISPSHSPKPDSYFVQFRPVNLARQGDLYQQQYDARRHRAEEEGMAYVFQYDADKPGTWWCFNPKSGETYEVGIFGCTCPDYIYRANRAGVPCKHMHALELQSDAVERETVIFNPLWYARLQHEEEQAARPKVQKSCPPRVFTTGYAQRSVEQMEAVLLAHDATICDIRFHPHSRREEWSKASLQARFGSRYFHLAGFGNRNFRTGGVDLADAGEAFAQLQAMMKQGQTCILLCACANPTACHRSEVSRWLAERGIESEELRW